MNKIDATLSVSAPIEVHDRLIPPMPEPGSAAERIAREVHRAWAEGMLKQGRPVPFERLSWDTISDQDKQLDRYIGARMMAFALADQLAADAGG